MAANDVQVSKHNSLVLNACSSLIDEKNDAFSRLETTHSSNSAWLVAAFKDSRKRFRMEETVLPTGESPARRPRASAVLAPRDMNVPVVSKEDSLLTPKSASASKMPGSSGCALPSGPLASADDADQPAIEAAKLFVSQLKYKDLQQELKGRGLSAKGNAEALQERLFSSMAEEILLRPKPMVGGCKALEASPSGHHVVAHPTILQEEVREEANKAVLHETIACVLSPLHDVVPSSSEARSDSVIFSASKLKSSVFGLFSGGKKLMSSKKTPAKLATTMAARSSVSSQEVPAHFSVPLSGLKGQHSATKTAAADEVFNGTCELEPCIASAALAPSSAAPADILTELESLLVQVAAATILESVSVNFPETRNADSTTSFFDQGAEGSTQNTTESTSAPTLEGLGEATLLSSPKASTPLCNQKGCSTSQLEPASASTEKLMTEDGCFGLDQQLEMSKPSNLATGFFSFQDLVERTDEGTQASTASLTQGLRRPTTIPSAATGDADRRANLAAAAAVKQSAHALKLEQIREKQKATKLLKEKERLEKDQEREQRIQAQKERAEREKQAQKLLLKEKAKKNLDEYGAVKVFGGDKAGAGDVEETETAYLVDEVQDVGVRDVVDSQEQHVEIAVLTNSGNFEASSKSDSITSASDTRINPIHVAAGEEAQRRAMQAEAAAEDYQHADDYDSYCMSEPEEQEQDHSDDDEQKSKPPKHIPSWAAKESLREALKHQADLKIDPDAIFFECNTCNLEDIFERCSKRYQKRTSSANWNEDKLSIYDKLVYKRSVGIQEA